MKIFSPTFYKLPSIEGYKININKKQKCVVMDLIQKVKIALALQVKQH